MLVTHVLSIFPKLSRKITNMSDDKAIKAAVDHYLAASELAPSGIRSIPKAAFVERLKDIHDLDDAVVKRVQTALNHETTVAHAVATHDLIEKIKATSKEDLKDDDTRRALTSTVRLPTHGGNTNVIVRAEDVKRLPSKGDGEQEYKTSYGRVGVKITTKSRIPKEFLEQGSAQIRKALGVKD